MRFDIIIHYYNIKQKNKTAPKEKKSEYKQYMLFKQSVIKIISNYLKSN